MITTIHHDTRAHAHRKSLVAQYITDNGLRRKAHSLRQGERKGGTGRLVVVVTLQGECLGAASTRRRHEDARDDFLCGEVEDDLIDFPWQVSHSGRAVGRQPRYDGV